MTRFMRYIHERTEWRKQEPKPLQCLNGDVVIASVDEDFELSVLVSEPDEHKIFSEWFYHNFIEQIKEND